MTAIVGRRSLLATCLSFAALGAMGCSTQKIRPLDAHMNRMIWYGSQASAMGEQFPLPSSENGSEVYRFLWLRTFHDPISVRLEPEATEARIIGKRASGAGGYEPGNLVETTTRSISAAESAELLRRLEGIDFWNMPTGQEAKEIGLDGAQWILEGVRGSEHHLVDRWTPDTATPYAAFCLHLVRLAELQVDEIY